MLIAQKTTRKARKVIAQKESVMCISVMHSKEVAVIWAHSHNTNMNTSLYVKIIAQAPPTSSQPIKWHIASTGAKTMQASMFCKASRRSGCMPGWSITASWQTAFAAGIASIIIEMIQNETPERATPAPLHTQAHPDILAYEKNIRQADANAKPIVVEFFLPARAPRTWLRNPAATGISQAREAAKRDTGNACAGIISVCNQNVLNTCDTTITGHRLSEVIFTATKSCTPRWLTEKCMAKKKIAMKANCRNARVMG